MRQTADGRYASTQELLPLEDVIDSVLCLRGGAYCAVVEAQSVNFALKSETEREAIMAGYRAFLNSLSYPIQVIVRVLPTDVEGYLAGLRERLGGGTSEASRRLALDHEGFVRRLARERTLLERRFYVTVPVGLEAAFERPHVSIDFAGFSGETLRDALAEVLDKVRVGRLAPETIAVRLMLSDMSAPMALPARAETQADDPAVRARAERITRRAAEGIIDQVRELGELGLVRSADAAVRVHGIAPTFKLYLLNNEEAFFGFYPAIERTVTIGGEPVAIYDLMGKDVPLFHYAVSDDDTAAGTQFVEASRAWFDSVWNSIAREYKS